MCKHTEDLCIVDHTYLICLSSFSSKFEDHEAYDLDQAEKIVRHAKFDRSKKTVMYFHGYIESPEVESVHVIVDAYQKRTDHNLIILDWTQLADGNYLLEAVPNCKKVFKVCCVIPYRWKLTLFPHITAWAQTSFSDTGDDQLGIRR